MGLDSSWLTGHVDKAIANAEAGRSKLGDWELSIAGMSSPAVRHLLNNLLDLPCPVRYLEVGTYKGSTLVAAMTGNSQVSAVAVDDFSWAYRTRRTKDGVKPKSSREIYRGIRGALDQNIAGIKGGGPVEFVEADFWKLSNEELMAKGFGLGVGQGPGLVPFGVYFYDGGHSRAEQRRAIVERLGILADTFLWIVDDYDMKDVREGTWDGIAAIERRFGVRTKKTWVLSREEDRGKHFSERFWWDGIFLGVFEK